MYQVQHGDASSGKDGRMPDVYGNAIFKKNKNKSVCDGVK
jgi:hypothetical protein